MPVIDIHNHVTPRRFVDAIARDGQWYGLRGDVSRRITRECNDETAALARSLRDELQAIWGETRKTVLFVTHDVMEAVQLSNRVIIVAYGGRKYAELTIDLPYPRHQTDAAVAAKQAEILALFEEMDRRRPRPDARIPRRISGQARVTE